MCCQKALHDVDRQVTYKFNHVYTLIQRVHRMATRHVLYSYHAEGSVAALALEYPEACGRRKRRKIGRAGDTGGRRRESYGRCGRRWRNGERECTGEASAGDAG